MLIISVSLVCLVFLIMLFPDFDTYTPVGIPIQTPKPVGDISLRDNASVIAVVGWNWLAGDQRICGDVGIHTFPSIKSDRPVSGWKQKKRGGR